ncbi:transcriptional repressor [Muricauda oceani]|uniref:Transcriptional repressor n=1 Tax=Flagellimonas oceani TaxID=2698672 RepID=A0A6G7J7U7_9FLAO|nr:transcriptional repressor [Allomuricauda oceani]MBW8242928.1 transcriptional repressor [Allomuricauda oceani]QII46709.1 transcriptional repressor [Allomuricauda oceani]
MKRRNTPTKQAILDVLLLNGKALSHDTIAEMVDIEINRATIYRILNQFCEDGLVHSIVAEDGKHYFAALKHCGSGELDHHHFHFRCTHCKTMVCLEQKVRFDLPEGYSVASANCVLTGTCMDCS